MRAGGRLVLLFGRIGSAMLIAALLAIVPSAGLPAVTVKPSTDGYIATVPEFELGQAPAIDSDIARRAAELCAGKDVEGGEVRSQQAPVKKRGAAPPNVSGCYNKFS